MEKQEKIFKEIESASNIWNPADMKEIEGEFIREEQGTYGKNYVLKCPSKEEFLVFGTTVLNTKMAKVAIGDYVRITFLEEVKSKDGRVYKDFKVETSE